MAIRIHTAEELRAFDTHVAGVVGLPSIVLMENAAAGLARALERRGRSRGRVAIVTGPGNNGGDGWALARQLQQSGADVSVWAVAPVASLRGDAATNAHVLEKLGFAAIHGLASFGKDTVVVDALFGTGLARPLSDTYAHAVAEVNAARERGAFVLAVDVPSGLDADRHHPIGPHVRADATCALHSLKLAHVQHPTREACGEVEVVLLGLRLEASGPRRRWLSADDVVIPERPVAAHKGTAGHVLVVAGSPEKTGAAVLACRAAFRSGAGLVSLASSPEVCARVVTALPEVMAVPLASASPEALAKAFGDKDALVVGPGLVASEDWSRAIAGLLEAVAVPCVIDADGLNSLASDPTGLALLSEAKRAPILTPHPAEAARLLGKSTADVQENRFKSARELSELTRATVLLKGACTVVAHPDGTLDVLPFEDPRLATAGSGDVLSGAIGGLLAQGASTSDAVLAGAWIHASSASAASGDRGLLAGDLADALPAAIGTLRRG